MTAAPSLGTVRDLKNNLGKWRVQIGRNDGKYTDKYVFPSDQPARACLHYEALNTHSGYKKRLVGPDGTIRLRQLT